jgi:hypothetical protein
MTPEDREVAIFYVALSGIFAIVMLALIYTYAIS